MKTKTLIAKQNQDMGAQLKASRQALYWSKEELDQQRLIRIKKLLKTAKQKSSWYAKQLKAIDIDSFTLEQMSEIPVLTKTTLMEHWDEIVTDPNLTLEKAENHISKMQHDDTLLYLDDRYHVLATSGTSGQRGVFIYDWDEWNTYYLMFKRYGVRGQNPMKKTKIAVIGVLDAVFGMTSLAKTYSVRKAQMKDIQITLPMKEIVKQLNSLKPGVLLSSPSGILKVCREAEEGRLNIQPHVISVGAEPFYEPIRLAIERIWPSADIYNSFGASEGIAAVNCQPGMREMHLNDDLCIVEPVDSHGNPVEKGNPSNKVLITNLFNMTLPLIRYEMPDSLIFIDKHCECGVAHQLIKEPQGRPSFDFIYKNELPVPQILFAASLLYERFVSEYQVIQTENGARIKVMTTGSVDFECLSSLICKKLLMQGLNNPEVTISKVSQFEYPASGKLARFIAVT